jgi:hypothetical protein
VIESVLGKSRETAAMPRKKITLTHDLVTIDDQPR